MTALYINTKGSNNHADMLVAYYVQQGSERAASMMYNKFATPAKIIVNRAMSKFNDSTQELEELVLDCLTAVIMQVKNSYKPNDGSNFNRFFTSVIKNTVKEHLKNKYKSTDALDKHRGEEVFEHDWGTVKPTDSTFE
jgi:hypothetical protein